MEKQNRQQQKKSISLKEKQLFIFDVEGVIVPSIDEPAVSQDVLETIEEIRKKGKKVAFLSNISRTPFFRVAEILMDLGVAKSQKEIFTAGKVAVEYVKSKSQKKGPRVFVISERGLLIDFEIENGVEVVFEKPVDFVVIGMKRNLNFEELNFALECLLEGAELISCGHTNYYKGKFGSKEGIFIGDLPICEMLSFASGKTYVKIGKPDPVIFGFILTEFEINPKYAVMIGDKIETDIYGAKNLGITSILVQGIETKKHFVPVRTEKEIKPDLEIKNLKDILAFI